MKCCFSLLLFFCCFNVLLIAGCNVEFPNVLLLNTHMRVFCVSFNAFLYIVFFFWVIYFWHDHMLRSERVFFFFAFVAIKFSLACWVVFVYHVILWFSFLSFHFLISLLLHSKDPKQKKKIVSTHNTLHIKYWNRLTIKWWSWWFEERKTK